MAWALGVRALDREGVKRVAAKLALLVKTQNEIREIPFISHFKIGGRQSKCTFPSLLKRG